jgi:hypothetical protein
MPSILGTSKRKRSPQVKEPNTKMMLVYLAIIVVGAIWNLSKKRHAGEDEMSEL